MPSIQLDRRSSARERGAGAVDGGRPAAGGKRHGGRAATAAAGRSATDFAIVGATAPAWADADPLSVPPGFAPARRRPGPEGGPATWGRNKSKGYWYVLYRGEQILTSRDKALVVEACAYHNLYERLPPRWLKIGDLLRDAIAACPIIEGSLAKMVEYCGRGALVGDIDRGWCQDYAAWRQSKDSPRTGRPVADSTVRGDLKDMLAIVRAAIPDKNLVVECWLPSEGKGREQWLDAAAFERLVHIALGRLPDPASPGLWLRGGEADGRRFLYGDPATRPGWSAVARLAMIGGHTATRRTMVCNTRWDECDGDGPEHAAGAEDLDSEEYGGPGDHGHFVLEQPPEPSCYFRKGANEAVTGKRGGEVPLTKRLRRFLLKARALDRARGIGAVIHDGNGGLLDIQYAWDQVRRAAGLPDGYTIHCLRRSAIMWMLLDDVPLDEICAFAMITLENLLENYAVPDPAFSVRVTAANGRVAASLRHLLAKSRRKDRKS